MTSNTTGVALGMADPSPDYNALSCSSCQRDSQLVSRSSYLQDYCKTRPASACHGTRARNLLQKVAATMAIDDSEVEADTDPWVLEGWGEEPSVPEKARLASINMQLKWAKNLPSALPPATGPGAVRRIVSAGPQRAWGGSPKRKQHPPAGRRPAAATATSSSPSKGAGTEQADASNKEGVNRHQAVPREICHSPNPPIENLEVGDESDVEWTGPQQHAKPQHTHTQNKHPEPTNNAGTMWKPKDSWAVSEGEPWQTDDDQSAANSRSVTPTSPKGRKTPPLPFSRSQLRAASPYRAQVDKPAYKPVGLAARPTWSQNLPIDPLCQTDTVMPGKARAVALAAGIAGSARAAAAAAGSGAAGATDPHSPPLTRTGISAARQAAKEKLQADLELLTQRRSAMQRPIPAAYSAATEPLSLASRVSDPQLANRACPKQSSDPVLLEPNRTSNQRSVPFVTGLQRPSFPNGITDLQQNVAAQAAQMNAVGVLNQESIMFTRKQRPDAVLRQQIPTAVQHLQLEISSKPASNDLGAALQGSQQHLNSVRSSPQNAHPTKPPQSGGGKPSSSKSGNSIVAPYPAPPIVSVNLGSSGASPAGPGPPSLPRTQGDAAVAALAAACRSPPLIPRSPVQRAPSPSFPQATSNPGTAMRATSPMLNFSPRWDRGSNGSVGPAGFRLSNGYSQK